MADLVQYQLDASTATLTLDDGKVNALSPAMLAAIGDALDRAEADGAAVVLAGRPGIFSAGFDLKTLQAGGAAAQGMLRDGLSMTARLLSHPRPVVAAVTGHAMAMGSFLALSCDYRVGADGPFKITANEVAIGMTLPYSAVEVMRQRLTPAAFNRAAILAEVFTPTDAVGAGWLDRVVTPDDVVATAVEAATAFAALDAGAHTETKRRVRADAVDAIRRGVDLDFGPAPSA